MGEKNKKTQYSKRIRITPRHLAWIEKNKNTKTMAGYLAQIIEKHIAQIKIHKLEHKEIYDKE